MIGNYNLGERLILTLMGYVEILPSGTTCLVTKKRPSCFASWGGPDAAGYMYEPISSVGGESDAVPSVISNQHTMEWLSTSTLRCVKATQPAHLSPPLTPISWFGTSV